MITDVKNSKFIIFIGQNHKMQANEYFHIAIGNEYIFAHLKFLPRIYYSYSFKTIFLCLLGTQDLYNVLICN